MAVATCWVYRSLQPRCSCENYKKCRFKFFLLQALAVVCLIGWSLASTYVLLRSIDFFLPFRAGSFLFCVTSLTSGIFPGIVEELLGADLMEHNILHKGIGVTETLDTLARSPQSTKSSSLWFCLEEPSQRKHI